MLAQFAKSDFTSERHISLSSTQFLWKFKDMETTLSITKVSPQGKVCCLCFPEDMLCADHQ